MNRVIPPNDSPRYFRPHAPIIPTESLDNAAACANCVAPRRYALLDFDAALSREVSS